MLDIAKYMGLLTEYQWAIMAILASPLMAYAFVQRYKANRRKAGKKGTTLFHGHLAGVLSLALTTGFWYKYSDDVEGAFYMGLIIGCLQPFIVAWMMGQIKKRAPEVYKEIKDGTDDTTVFIPTKKNINEARMKRLMLFKNPSSATKEEK